MIPTISLSQPSKNQSERIITAKTKTIAADFCWVKYGQNKPPINFRPKNLKSVYLILVPIYLNIYFACRTCTFTYCFLQKSEEYCSQLISSCYRLREENMGIQESVLHINLRKLRQAATSYSTSSVYVYFKGNSGWLLRI